MQVKIIPNYHSSGTDHHITDGYMICNSVAEVVLVDGEELKTNHERYIEVKRIVDKSPNKIELYQHL